MDFLKFIFKFDKDMHFKIKHEYFFPFNNF